MKVRVGIRHNLVGAVAGFRPPKEDVRAYARRMRPNAAEAAALFESDWQGLEIERPEHGTLMLTVLLDHAGTLAANRRLAVVPGGWAAVIHMGRDLLMLNGREREIGDIADTLEAEAREILVRVALLGSPPPTARNRSARRGAD